MISTRNILLNPKRFVNISKRTFIPIENIQNNDGKNFYNLIPSLPNNPNVPYLPYLAKNMTGIPSFQEVFENFEPIEPPKNAKYGGLTIDKYQYLVSKVGNYSNFMKPTICYISETDLVVHYPALQVFIGNPIANCLHGGVIASMNFLKYYIFYNIYLIF